MRVIGYLMCLLPALAWCNIMHVESGGSIQTAISTASNGDTIIIHDGVYSESIIAYGKLLTVGSEYLLDGDTAHIGATIIRPDYSRVDTQSCAIWAFNEPEGGRLAGLTLDGGTGTMWALTGNTAGGAVYVNESRLSIEQCRIQNSSAYRGGGLFVGWNHTSGRLRSNVSLIQSTIINCMAETWGGGVFLIACSLRVHGCEITQCVSPIYEGAVCALNCLYEMDSCLVHYCSGDVGGVVCVDIVGHISACIFENNFGSSLEGINDLAVANSRCPVTHCTFRSGEPSCTSVDLVGQGQYAQQFFGNLIENVQAPALNGVVYVSGGHGTVAYNIFRGNTNLLGGVLVITDGSNARVRYNVFENNTTVLPALGSAIYIISLSHPVIDSNVFINNRTPALGIEEESVHALSVRNNWWGDASGPYHPTWNPFGRGDTIFQDSVYVFPWLTEPPDTTMPPSFVRERPEILSTWKLMAVYPNPFNSSVRLIVAGFAGKDFSVTLHNLLGQEVAVLHHGALTGGEIVFTAPPNLASGVYFLKAADHLSIETRKIVLLR